jgi:F-type H+-transporting ATPase subunit beta
MANEIGRVIQIQGSVVDVEFPEGELPDVFEALEIPRGSGGPLVLEVEKHLGQNRVRCVSMDTACSVVYRPRLLVHRSWCR